MHDWEKALDKFLRKWKNNNNLVGILVCGSYVTGNATPESDIDVQIILDDTIDWRERGNLYIDDFLIEYFINPIRQIKSYFIEEYESYKVNSATMFATGVIIEDKKNILKDLQTEAKEWISKTFPDINHSQLEVMKYTIWNYLEDVKASVRDHYLGFNYLYYSYLSEITEMYRKFLGYDRLRPEKIIDILEEEKYRKRYRLRDFPDKKFAELLLKSIQAINDKEKMLCYQNLTEYLLNKMGGFNIDGWSLKSNLRLHQSIK
ncbi:MAG: nucleotidyltransferase domain-containing protein [Candidatus Thorarchaeota archaeon]